MSIKEIKGKFSGTVGEKYNPAHVANCMQMINVLVNKTNEVIRKVNAEAERNEPWAQLTAKAPAKKDGWGLEFGEAYWYFSLYGNAIPAQNNGSTFDLMCIRLGNCAPTEEELRAKEPEILRALRLEKWEG